MRGLLLATVFCLAPRIVTATPAAADPDEGRTYAGPDTVTWSGDDTAMVGPAAPTPEVDTKVTPTSTVETRATAPAPEGRQDAKEKKGGTPKVLQAVHLGNDSLVLGGYIQPGYIHVVNTEFNDQDQDGFDFANARFTGRGTKEVIDDLYVGFKFNFDVNRGNFGVRDVYGSVFWRDGLVGMDIGQLKQPFSLALLQSESKLQFSFSPDTRQIAFGRDQGLRLRSEGVVGKRVWMKGMVMVANGEGGFRQLRNNDDELQYTARYEIAPLGEMELVEGDLKTSKARFVLGGNVGYTPSLGKGLGLNDVGARETRMGFDGRVQWNGVSARAEYIRGFRGRNGAEGRQGRYGVVAQAGYVLPIPIRLPKFELVFRYQQYDLNAQSNGFEDPDNPVADLTERRIYEPGLNIYVFEQAAKLMISYQLTDLTEGPKTDVNGDPLFGDTVFAFFQFAWL